jgi:hypothetical protein
VKSAALRVLTVAGIAAALLLPALWNRYPLLYYDTLDYITMPDIWRMPVYRTGGYGVFALTGKLAGSLWGIAGAQALLVAYVMDEAFRLLAPDLGWRRLGGIFAALLLFSAMPWVVSEVMPDALTGAVVLATLLLALKDAELGPWRRGALAAILGIGAAVHPTHIAILGGLLICVFVLGWLAGRGLPFARMRLRGAVAGLALGVVLSAFSNWMMTGQVFLAPKTTSTLTMAVLIEDGLAKRYLADVCPEPAPRKPLLCRFEGKLPNDANDFLWHSQAFWDLDGWAGFMDEAPWMVEQIALRYPLQFLWTATRLTTRQFVTLRTGEGFEPMQFFIGDAMRIFWWWEIPAFQNARQQMKEFGDHRLMDVINDVHVPVALVSFFLLCGLAVVAYRRREETAATIALLAILAYLGNTFLCGAISNPADRYGARIAWVLVWALLVLLPVVVRPGGRGRSSAAD